jgi:exodeoxyribonuclease VII large subunit
VPRMNRPTEPEIALSNQQEWTVSSLSNALKRTLEDAFGHVRLRGEVSGYRGPHSSGHVYFSLKEEGAKLDAVVWKGVWNRLKVRPEEGMEVIVTGRITTFPGSSKYQIVIESIEPAGLGALMAILEERRLRLAAEGLFDEARKQRLPFLPAVIGVITSPSGAVIRDILHRLADRFPRHVLVWPVRVQGETSATEVAAAIRGFNALAPDGPIRRPDVIIVARGGGSLEDLWSFNEEIVVRAAAASRVPLVSAIGHETDWTLIDHAADLRAPTPTAAAEKVVPVRADLIVQVADLARRHEGAMRRLSERRRTDLRGLLRVLPRADDVLAVPRQRLDLVGGRLKSALAALTRRHEVRFARVAQQLVAEAPRQRLARIADHVRVCGRALETAFRANAQGRTTNLARIAARLSVQPLLARIERRHDQMRVADERLSLAFAGLARQRRTRLDTLWRLATNLSHAGVLARGFALVRDGEGRPLASAASVRPGMALDIGFADGHVPATAAGRTAAKPSRQHREEQRNLFEP